MSSYDTIYVQPRGNDDTHVEPLIAHNGTMRIMTDAGSIIVRSEIATTASLTIYSATGQAVQTAQIDLTRGVAQTTINGLPTGVYIARAKNADGESCACKFVVR